MNTKTSPSAESNANHHRGLESPSTINKIILGLALACILLLLFDLLPFYEKHVHFKFEKWFGFFAFFGFIVYAVLVFAGRFLRIIVRREEDYYDR